MEFSQIVRVSDANFLDITKMSKHVAAPLLGSRGGNYENVMVRKIKI